MEPPFQRMQQGSRHWDPANRQLRSAGLIQTSSAVIVSPGTNSRSRLQMADLQPGVRGVAAAAQLNVLLVRCAGTGVRVLLVNAEVAQPERLVLQQRVLSDRHAIEPPVPEAAIDAPLGADVR